MINHQHNWRKFHFNLSAQSIHSKKCGFEVQLLHSIHDNSAKRGRRWRKWKKWFPKKMFELRFLVFAFFKCSLQSVEMLLQPTPALILNNWKQPILLKHMTNAQRICYNFTCLSCFIWVANLPYCIFDRIYRTKITGFFSFLFWKCQ